MSQRLQKLLASAGFGSRRELEQWISAGRVSVNGNTAVLGDCAEFSDEILVDGHLVSLQPREVCRVLIYNKSEGEVSTQRDPKDRPTVFDRLPKLYSGRWIAVGRLDINTTGLLLFTNWGELAHRLMHPSFEIKREYLVRVYGRVDGATLSRLTDGVDLEDGLARFHAVTPHNCDVDAEGQHLRNGWFRVTLSGGKNREVRRLWESQGAKVSRLKRISYGSIRLPPVVKRSESIEITQNQLDQLVSSVGLNLPRYTEKRAHGVRCQRRNKKIFSRRVSRRRRR